MSVKFSIVSFFSIVFRIFCSHFSIQVLKEYIFSDALKKNLEEFMIYFPNYSRKEKFENATRKNYRI